VQDRVKKEQSFLIFNGKKKNEDCVQLVSICGFYDVITNICTSRKFFYRIRNSNYVELPLHEEYDSFMLTVAWGLDEWTFKMEIYLKKRLIKISNVKEQWVPERVVEKVLTSFLLKIGEVFYFIAYLPHQKHYLHSKTKFHRYTSQKEPHVHQVHVHLSLNEIT
jgi:hypothetical protein